jgi:hypothetical protein
MNIIALLAVLLILTSCESQQDKVTRVARELKIAEQNRLADEDRNQKIATATAAAAEKIKLEQEAKKVTFEKLKSKFVQEKDKFDNDITWRHRSYTKFFNTNGRGIVAEIINNRLKCYSAYVSDDWLFHTSFTLKIGDKQKSFSGKEQHEVVSGIAECVNLNSDDSQELAQFIAESDPKQPVLMRFMGKWYKDITLSQSHRKAITETWQFFDSMK